MGNWSFPILLADLFNGLEIVDSTFDLGENVNTRRTTGGVLVVGEYGERLWRGTIRTRILENRSQETVMSAIRTIQGARATFYVRPHHINGHSSGVSTAKIDDVLTSNNYRIRFKSLAAGKVISDGDFFSFSISGKYYLHQVTRGGTADGTGLTPYIEVEPAIYPTWAVNTPVDFATPQLVARYVPRSLRTPHHRSVLSDGPQFDWEQVL